ncbi:MAG TPA: nucleotidyltransferase domain-containing protein [Bdellovibrionota bacterium]|nr:nucleotidyltransferase domain-containing protein [Bdellovibrionota bacterium]
MNPHEFIESVVDWAKEVKSISSVLLVGSYARGNPKPNSDIDLVILSEGKDNLVSNPTWVKFFGPCEKISTEDWGALSSIRVFYSSGLEVEFGISTPAWASVAPMDSGTLGVVRDAAKILWDPRGELDQLLKMIPEP